MITRAYSTLEVKSVSDASGKRLFSGIASTPSTDMVGDIMDPHGAQFTLPLALLWQHDAKQPIGWIRKAVSTDSGIHVEAEVADVAEAGLLKDRLDMAWQSMKAGLVRGLSIGFKGIDAVPLRGRGMHYKRWHWLELSAVTLAMNQEATITAIKSADLFAPGCKPRVDFKDWQHERAIAAELPASLARKTVTFDALELVLKQVLKAVSESQAEQNRRIKALEQRDGST